MSGMILVDETHPLFDRSGMHFKDFPSDFRQIRYFTLLVVQKAPPAIKEINLLEQQVSELIKNAVKHGNRGERERKVKVWFRFSAAEARLVVEDEGTGFQEIERWNSFNQRRLQLIAKGDYGELVEYVSFRGQGSDERDGGNALFAALEYWDAGVVFNQRGNAVAVGKSYPQQRLSLI
jgi:hypothetical protein